MDEEDFEEEDDIKSEYNEFFAAGTEVLSEASKMRLDELLKRKEEVIAILNDSYQDDGEESEDENTSSITNDRF